jgi:hypothetical protein
MACHACGGPEDDERIRRQMGCDGPTKRPHHINLGDETFELNTCPRQYMQPGAAYMKACRWSKMGNLGLLYPRDIPARVADAIDLVENEVAKRQRLEMEK